MLKSLVPNIATELFTVHGNVPFFLRQLHNLNPIAHRLAMLYLRWKLGQMHPLDIEVMLDSGKITANDLDLFVANLS